MRNTDDAPEIGILTTSQGPTPWHVRVITGDRPGRVLDGDGEIAGLAEGERIVGRLIHMCVATAPDGTAAARNATLLDLDSHKCADLLWDHARRCGVEQSAISRLKYAPAVSPASIPLFLAFAKPSESDWEIDAHVIAAGEEIPPELWLAPELWSHLFLAPPYTLGRAITLQLQRDPSLALAAIEILAVKFSWRVEEVWIDELWEALPEARTRILRVARSIGEAIDKRLDSVRWISRATEAGEDCPELWAVLKNGLQEGSITWSDLPEDWEALAAAPWAFIDIACERQLPNAASACQSIRHSTAPEAFESRAPAQKWLHLSQSDRQLAQTWCSAVASTGTNEAANEISLAQMMSARAAEKFAKHYFERLGYQADDVAIEQLGDQTPEWRVMDIKVDRKFGVDVKNVRRTVAGQMASSRWRVKAFKNDARGAAVLLCGVSSPYAKISDHRLLCAQDEPIHVLGVATAGEIAQCAREFGTMCFVRFNQASKLFELPAWVWDYPFAHYRARDEALGRLRQELLDNSASRVGMRCLEGIPAVLASFFDIDLPPTVPLTAQQHEMLRVLREYNEARATHSKHTVPRLAWLYLFILHFWMYWRAKSDISQTMDLVPLFEWRIGTRDNCDGLPTDAQRLADERLRHHESPAPAAAVGIADPSDTLGKLFQALSAMEQHISRDLFIRLSDVTLYENGVLVGLFPDGTRKTLLAHCGGRTAYMAECGYRPLVFGLHETCACGRLICPKCRSCSDVRYVRCNSQAERHAERDRPGDVYSP